MYQQLNSGICFVALVFFICRVQCMIDDSSEDGDQNAFENHTMRSFIQVQKCCPEDQMMVELAHVSGPKVQCQSFSGQEGVSAFLQWAPDYLGNDERIRPFEELHNLTATEENDQTSVLCAALHFRPSRQTSVRPGNFRSINRLVSIHHIIFIRTTPMKYDTDE